MSVHQRLIFGYQGGTPTPTDPYFSSVSLLLHGDGTNGSTTATDSSSSPKTMTAVGGASLSTARQKYGSASLAFASTGDRFSTPSHAGFLFGSGDFTVEAWVYLTALSTDVQVVGLHRYGTDNLWLLYVTASGRLAFYNQAATGIVGTTETVALNTWTDVAVARSGGTSRIYVAGGADGSVADTHNYSAYAHPLTVGCDSTASVNSQLLGNVDDVRVTKGVARYTASFTPPAAAFPDS